MSPTVQAFVDQHKLSRLGFGCMRLPTLGSEDQIDLPQMIEMVDAYMQAGYNYFDTAYMYHGGKSELFVKDAVTSRYPRESYVLVDKLPIWSVNEKADVEKIFNDQLEKCGVDYFDIYLLHAMNGDNNRKHEEMGSYEFCREMQRQGKIKLFGFSYHGSTEDLEAMLAKHGDAFDLVQLQLNYFDWEKGWAKEQYEVVKKYNKPVVTMEPVRGGMLAQLPKQIGQHLTDADDSVSQASWAIRWLLDLPQVAVVLSGMSNLTQIHDNIKSVKETGPLTTEQAAVVKQVAEELVAMPRVPCTTCNYCIEDCPQGIPIPELFKMYNDYLEKRQLWQLKKDYATIDADKNAQACINCGICVSLCPQEIQIPERLKEIAALITQ